MMMMIVEGSRTGVVVGSREFGVMPVLFGPRGLLRTRYLSQNFRDLQPYSSSPIGQMAMRISPVGLTCQGAILIRESSFRRVSVQ